jgi:hypothetical protein
MPGGLVHMDATLTIERVAFALDRDYRDLIDMGDVSPKPTQEYQSQFLSRALAAFCVSALTETDAKLSANSVTDGFGDHGIDAIHFDSADKSLYLVQSKWSKAGKTTVSSGDCEKFLSGIEALIRGDFSEFNPKIKSREPELSDILRRSDVRIVLVVAYSSPNPLADPVRNSIERLLADQNNVGDAEIFSLEVFDLPRVYAHLSGAASAKNIKIQMALSEWAKMDSPYRAYYGQVKLSDVATWAKLGKPLFDRNLRFYRGASDVNTAMESTIQESPDRFWYFNNGITVLCSKVEKTVLNGDNRDYGIFDCQGVSIVNGAQTVGVVWEYAKKHPKAFKKLDARVHIRLISLEHCPDGFETEVTRATNTQNRIQHRDFAALDPNQERLAGEMALDGKRYAYKSGDLDPEGDDGCNIEEATIALACASSDVTMAVQAKREVGGLWRDISKPPYTALFSDSLPARRMWRAVKISRVVTEELTSIDKADLPRGELVAVHGNRFILHHVFRDSSVKEFRDPNRDEAAILVAARKATQRVLYSLAEIIEEKHSKQYLANLFKNAQKCKELKLPDHPDPTPAALFTLT